ncbi:MAG: helix-turn-helix domain-containing protein [Flavobacteriales bacterium]
MSHIIVNLIRRLPIKNPAKAVLWVIADIADDKGYAYPSHATLAAECGVTDRTIINCIQQLEACGVLVANRTNGRHTTYTVTPENFTKIEPNPRTTFTPEPRSPLNHVHHTPEPRSPHPRTTFTQPLNDVHTNPHKPSINPQVTPSVYAQEKIEAVIEAVEQPAPAPIKKTKTEKVGITPALMIESLPELSESVASDFLAYRKTKKAPLTPTAWKYMVPELVKAATHGYSPDDALAETMVAGWQSVKSDWLVNRNKSKSQQVSQSNWQQQQNEKWGGFLDGVTTDNPKTASPRLKTVNPENVIPFGALRHG